MPVTYKPSESDGGITLIIQFLDLGMSVQALLRLAKVVKVGMQRRKPCLVSPFVLGYSKLCPETQVLQDEPLEYEIVGKSESLACVIVVQMRIPQRIGHRIVIKPFFRVIKIFIYAPPRNYISGNKGLPGHIQRTGPPGPPYPYN